MWSPSFGPLVWLVVILAPPSSGAWELPLQAVLEQKLAMTLDLRCKMNHDSLCQY